MLRKKTSKLVNPRHSQAIQTVSGRFIPYNENPLKSNLSVTIRASLELMRPANIVTAFADILAGTAAAAGILMLTESGALWNSSSLYWLLFSTFGLYGGGIVFNDVFDASLDAKERPERAIPSGRVSKPFAATLGALLFVIGILSAFWVNNTAGVIAITITVCALIYDTKAKHNVVLGPLFMGSCRGGNLLLGVSLFPAALPYLWPLAFIPVFYIGAITLVSRGEVHGGSKTTGVVATVTVSAITALLLLLSMLPSYKLLSAMPFALLFGLMVIPPYISAANTPSPVKIKKAIKRGVISLIILNSALAAGFAGILTGLIVLALLPVSLLFAKLFAVT